MTFADELRKQRARPVAIWQQFVSAYRADASDLYAFFEGDDDSSFYLPILRNRWPGAQVRSFSCKGKAAVLAMLDKCRQAGPSLDRTTFFVDKDLDDYLSCSVAGTDTRLFETGVYSIENYLVSNAAVHAIWTDLFHLPESDGRLAIVVEQLQRGVSGFARCATPLMAWILYHREKGTPLNLAGLSAEKIYFIDDELRARMRRGAMAYVRQETGVSDSGGVWRSVAQKSRRLRGTPMLRYIRGKLMLWYFVSAIRKVESLLVERGGPEGTRARVRVQLAVKNAIDLLAGRVPVPHDLTSFLRQHPELGSAA